jgi:hypothetical protein
MIKIIKDECKVCNNLGYYVLHGILEAPVRMICECNSTKKEETKCKSAMQ